MFFSRDGFHQRIALAGLAVAMMLVSSGLAAGLEPSPGESLASHWTLRLDMPDTFCEDATVRARLVLMNVSGHTLQTRFATGGLNRLPERSFSVFLRDSSGQLVPRVGVVGSSSQDIAASAFRPGDSLVGAENITAAYQESWPIVPPRPLRVGSYTARATCSVGEMDRGVWRRIRLASNEVNFRVVIPPDSLRDAQRLIREARGIAWGKYDGTQWQRASGLLHGLLRQYASSDYGREAIGLLLMVLSGPNRGLSRDDRARHMAAAVALRPNDLLIDYYMSEAWLCTARRSRHVLVHEWRKVPAGTRLARLLDAYQADLK